jgi:hypothetical protein
MDLFDYHERVQYALGILAVAFLIVVVAGLATGRVRASSCCSTSAADPRRDRRMASAFAGGPEERRDRPEHDTPRRG